MLEDNHNGRIFQSLNTISADLMYRLTVGKHVFTILGQASQWISLTISPSLGKYCKLVKGQKVAKATEAATCDSGS